MFQRSTVKIIAMTDNGIQTCSAAARISTTEGSALDVLEKGRDDKKNLSLIKKVLSSGHKSILEHHQFTLAFNDVSVLVEQYMIESRLASFMVKSRRYVDFSNAGYHVPQDLSDDMRRIYCENVEARFSDYGALLEYGISKEDARFVLPYCFYSNFYLTVNARQLVQMVLGMTTGRGSRYAEIKALGESIQTQFDAVYPGVIDSERAHYAHYAQEPGINEISSAHAVESGAELLNAPTDAKALLRASMEFSERFETDDFSALLRDARPRELESLNYTFKFKNVSLSCITHFARHRMHSPLFPGVARALSNGGYIFPHAIAQNERARSIYENAFAANSNAAGVLLAGGMDENHAGYLALSGNVVDFMTTVNARELLIFSKLRVCRRAQWEIRLLMRDMLDVLRQDFPELFMLYGPSCLVDGRCPEGRLSCGRPFASPGDF